ncbi:membrane-associated transporter protein [Biomphalaria glabrata]|nr:membrane-associated transporter protein [Biomphalaria glabrata]
MDGISQSLQASLLVQKRQEAGHAFQEDGQQKGVGRCWQLLLVSAVCGIEMCLSFEQIYAVLILQYLGVPVNLVSINGVVCGGISMVLLPILGVLADKGSNPKMKKTATLIVGMFTFLSGLSILAFCGIIKMDKVPADLTKVNSSQIFNDYNSTISVFDYNSTANDSMTPGVNDNDYSSLPLTAFLSITGFALMDIGFDISMSLTRAFVLEVVPSFQHTRMLMVATIAQSLAGTTFSGIGCFDFPGILGPIFQVDGVAATLLCFCAILFGIIVLSYLTTIFSGLFISRKQRVKYEHLRQGTRPEVKSLANGRHPAKARRRLEFHDERRPYKPDILHTEVRDPATRPLMRDDSVKGYSSMSSTSMALSSSGTQPTDDRRKAHNSKLTFSKNCHKSEHRESESRSEVGDSSVDAKEIIDKAASSTCNYMRSPSLKHSLSSSLALIQSPLGDFHSRKLAELQRESKNFGKHNLKKKPLFHRRLVILCVACFFSIGASTCIVVYAANVLTISIYEGDPMAELGTEGYLRYTEGLRMAAFGFLVMNISNLITSLCNQMIVNILGEQVYFVVTHSLLLLTLVTLLVTQTVEVYFIFMVVYGMFRSTIYTLTFVLVNKFHQEKFQPLTEDSHKDVGKLMTMIGFLIPSHYMLVSSIMGPLMDLTGNVWTPLLYTMASGALGLLIFLSLFFVKAKPASTFNG